jgi:hypothetical protein
MSCRDICQGSGTVHVMSRRDKCLGSGAERQRQMPKISNQPCSPQTAARRIARHRRISWRERCWSQPVECTRGYRHRDAAVCRHTARVDVRAQKSCSPGRAPEDADGTVLSMQVHMDNIVDTAPCAPVRAVRGCYLEIRTDPGSSRHRQTERRASISRPKVGTWQLPTRLPKWEVRDCDRCQFTLTLEWPQRSNGVPS